MLDIFFKILDTLFPKTSERKILATENVEHFLRHFEPRHYLDTYILSSYKNPNIRAIVTLNKFHDNQKASKLLATLLDQWNKTLSPIPTLYVPIPLSAKREWERGYNQVTRVLSYTESVKFAPLIKRTKHTRPQTSLARTERFNNMKDVFVPDIVDKENFPYKRVIIIDDVITTGATLKSAKKALASHLPQDCQIICVALAH